MASEFHPVYASLWNDDKFDNASFEGIAFFAYLFTNHRVRPSGIYRATTEQLAGDARLPVKRVHGYLADLMTRGVIVRDGSWLFVVSYFKRQPKGPWLMKGVHADLALCSSRNVLFAFREKYPLLDQQVQQRLEQLSDDGCPPTQLNATQLQRNATHTPRACVDPDGFEEFWETWPSNRRILKPKALAAWCALAPDPALRQTILAAVEASKPSADWQRENGRYIQHPHRWLANRRWEDPIPAAQTTLLTSKTEGNQAAAAAFLRRMGANPA